MAITTSATALARSVPVPSAIPTSAAASAGASFRPSPTIATRPPRARSSAIFAALPSGRIEAKTWSAGMPTSLADRQGGRRLVAGQEVDLGAELADLVDGLPGVRLDRVGQGDGADGPAVDGHAEHGPGLALPGSGRRLERGEVDPGLGQEPRRPDQDLRAVDPGRDPRASDGPEPFDRFRPSMTRQGAGQRVLAAGLGGGGEAEQLDPGRIPRRRRRPPRSAGPR